ncbi:hypothetical protein HK096_002785 [Nowakowskiella sp. JEL0078]|nr:hypothetical protein HK096_002785 [Nowakowskiella sp. JEL0078]
MSLATVGIIFASYFLITSINASGEDSQHYTWKNVEIGGGGFVPGIIFSPLKRDLIYARTDIGGAYKWNPSTGRWVQLLNWVSASDWDLLGIDSIAADPVNVNRVYALAGTYTNSWDPNNGTVLRSDNQGSTWSRYRLPFKVGGNMPGRGMGERIAVDPNNNNILYLGARSGNGLWKSTNAGQTWSKVSNFPVTGTFAEDPTNDYGKDPLGISWIKFDDKSKKNGKSQTIYVMAAETSVAPIYVSKDAGLTWSVVAGQPIGYLPHRAAVAPDGNFYLSYSNQGGPYDGTLGYVYKYSPSSGNWTDITPVRGSSFGYGGITVDRLNPKTIMVAALNQWWPDSNIWRSTDGGATWNAFWTFGNYPEKNLRYTLNISSVPWLDLKTGVSAPEPAVKLGWMMESLEIDPFNSDRFILPGTGMTLYGSNDLTNFENPSSTVTIQPLVLGQEEVAVIDLISPPTGPVLHSSIADISGFTHYDLTKPPDQVSIEPRFTSGRSIDYAELKPSFIVRSGDASGSHIAFSSDSGSTWTAAATEPAGVTGGGILAVAADASIVLWAPGGSAGVFYTTDNGTTWTTVAGLPAGAYIGADRVNPLKFYATSANIVYLSLDGGKTFNSSINLSFAINSNRPLKGVPGTEGTVFACLQGGLAVSVNSGVSFNNASTSVSFCGSYGFGIAGPGPYSVAIYLAGTVDRQSGIFRSDNGGKSWFKINDNAHQYGSLNFAITGDLRTYGRVFVATNGLGIVYGTKNNVATTIKSTTATKTTTTKTTKTSSIKTA